MKLISLINWEWNTSKNVYMVCKISADANKLFYFIGNVGHPFCRCRNHGGCYIPYFLIFMCFCVHISGYCHLFRMRTLFSYLNPLSSQIWASLSFIATLFWCGMQDLTRMFYLFMSPMSLFHMTTDVFKLFNQQGKQAWWLHLNLLAFFPSCFTNSNIVWCC